MIGEKLKELRMGYGYSQNFVAKKLCMSRESYSKYERDERNPSTETLAKLADLYGVSLDYLLSRTNISVSINTLDPAKQKAILSVISCSNLFSKIIVEVSRLDKSKN